MDKQAFKQRMQNLKSYQENNPGKGYWDWRNSLPDNLKYTDDTEYNMRGAYESGAQPTLENDGFYHLPTRNPQTGEILKTSLHPTFWKGLAEDAKIGYNAYFVGDKVYTKSKEEGPINVYTDGGEVARKSLKDIRKESIIEDKLDEDAANITPIGDALSARDVYNAVTEKDWTGAGLAAATMIPFVPMTVKQFRKKYKGISPKSKQNYNSKLMDKTVQNYIDNADSYEELKTYFDRILEEYYLNTNE